MFAGLAVNRTFLFYLMDEIKQFVEAYNDFKKKLKIVQLSWPSPDSNGGPWEDLGICWLKIELFYYGLLVANDSSTAGMDSR